MFGSETGIRPSDYGSPVTEIPDAETAPNKHNGDEDSKSIRDHFTALETKQVKCKRSLQVLRKHAENSTSLYGLQYRPSPHIRFDQKIPDRPRPP